MNELERYIDSLADDFGRPCSLAVTSGESYNVYREQSIYHMDNGYVFYPNDNRIRFTLNMVQYVRLERAGICIYISIP